MLFKIFIKRAHMFYRIDIIHGIRHTKYVCYGATPSNRQADWFVTTRAPSMQVQ
jgi:hypothetical protein